MNPIEESLRRLVAATSALPPKDASLDQLLALADAIAKEREPVFKEMSTLLQKGTRLTDTARALVEQLQAADRVWRDRLDAARNQLSATRADARAHQRGIAAYGR